MELTELTQEQRRGVFIKATDTLRAQKIKYSEIARIMHQKVPRMDYSRMKNLRVDPPNTWPSIEEIEALFNLFPDELAGIMDELSRPSPEQQKMQALEERIRALEQWNEKERAELLLKVARLELELEKTKKK